MHPSLPTASFNDLQFTDAGWDGHWWVDAVNHPYLSLSAHGSFQDALLHVQRRGFDARIYWSPEMPADKLALVAGWSIIGGLRDYRPSR